MCIYAPFGICLRFVLFSYIVICWNGAILALLLINKSKDEKIYFISDTFSGDGILPAESDIRYTLRLTVETAVQIARRQSLDVVVARHSFRSAYWNYCFYKQTTGLH